jgi:Pretoxin HINT domain
MGSGPGAASKEEKAGKPTPKPVPVTSSTSSTKDSRGAPAGIPRFLQTSGDEQFAAADEFRAHYPMLAEILPKEVREGRASGSVSVPLYTLLRPEATFVDRDIWEDYAFAFEWSSLVGDEPAADLLRNEMMRRYFAGRLSPGDPVRIEVTPPLGPGAPIFVVFRLGGHDLDTSDGTIGAPELSVFGPIEPVIEKVQRDALYIELTATVLAELDNLAALVNPLVMNIRLEPRDFALNDVLHIEQGVHIAGQLVDEWSCRSGPTLRGASKILSRYAELLADAKDAGNFAKGWHKDNTMESAGQANERRGSSGHWYSALGWSVVEAVETVGTLGAHGTRTQIAEAYQAGDISWNEAADLVDKSTRRAVIMAAVGAALGPGASRFGIGIFSELGVGTVGTRVLASALGGGITNAGVLASQTLTTRFGGGGLSARGQKIWAAGAPGRRDWAFGIGLGTFLGGLHGGRAPKGPSSVADDPLSPPSDETPAASAVEDRCFVAGTPVLTADGLRPIEMLRVGDKVLVCDPDSGEQELQPVLELTSHSAIQTLDIHVGGVVITCSPTHPFWVPGEGWVRAGNLEPGTPLMQRSGDVCTVVEIRRHEGDFTVFNLSVGGAHTYFVGEAEILVHNKPVRFYLRDRSALLERHASEMLDNAEALPADAPTRPHFIGLAQAMQREVADVAAKGMGAVDDAALEGERPAIERLERETAELNDLIDTVHEAPGLEADVDALLKRSKSIPFSSPAKLGITGRIQDLQQRIADLRGYIDMGLIDSSLGDDLVQLRKEVADLTKEVAQNEPGAVAPPALDPWQKRLAKAVWSDHDRKHMMARTVEEAREMTTPTDRNSDPASQYLPGINNEALELEALRRGEIIRGDNPGVPGSTVHVKYDFGPGHIVGYDRGVPVTSIRAEITSGDVFHGHPRNFDAE